MKKFLLVLSWGLAGLLIGCGQAKTKVDVEALTPAFSSASATTQERIRSAAAAVSANDYAAALAPLNAVIAKGSLTPEQKDALSVFLTAMQRVVAESPSGYSLEVDRGLSDLVGRLHGFEDVRRWR